MIIHETYGDGVEALVAGRRVRVGRAAFAGARPAGRRRLASRRSGSPSTASLAGAISCSDPLRGDAAAVVERVRRPARVRCC